MARRGERGLAVVKEEFAADPQNSLSEVDYGCGGYEKSRGVLERLLREVDRVNSGADGDRELILEIGRCANQHLLFKQFVAHRKGHRPWWRFVETVLLLPSGAWEDGGGTLDRDIVVMLVDGDLLSRIAHRGTPNHKAIFEAVTDSTHPLYSVFNFEPYWRTHMGHFMESGDFKRAWDTIREAHRGFMISNREPEEHEECDMKAFRENPANRCCAASQDALRVLVDELFRAMVKKGVITALHKADYVAPPDTVKATVWRFGKRRAAMVENRYPARALVLSLGRITRETKRSYRVPCPVSEPRVTVCKFAWPSAQAYKIARHFQERKGAKKAPKTAAQ
jgi:hypothetical protein